MHRQGRKPKDNTHATTLPLYMRKNAKLRRMFEHILPQWANHLQDEYYQRIPHTFLMRPGEDIQDEI